MWRIGFVVACGIAATGCSNKNQDGLPPASEWQAEPVASAATGPSAPSGVPTPPAAMGGAPQGMGGAPHGSFGAAGDGDPANPHAGLNMGDTSDPSNPHAGLNMGDTSDPSNPHAGLNMGGTDVTKLGLSAPDPDRQIDPAHHITGMISVDAKAKDKVKPGTSIFIIVKRAGADGAPSGPPLAVDKLTWAAAGVPFELTEAQAMVAGTQLTGDVVVMARYDQDSDALTKEPGDVTGQVRVKIPSDHVKLSLDTILP